MRKILCLIVCTLCVSGTAFAAEVYPSRIETVSENGAMEIHKIYELSGDETPDLIPKSDFEQDGYLYRLRDILKTEMPQLETKEMSEPVTAEADSGRIESILPLIPATKDILTEDGFSGVLSLDISTIKVESKGTGTSSYTMTATRTYPSLAGADLQYIPKTTVENGVTLQFDSVDWQSDNTAAIDGNEITDRYTAVVTYSGKASRSYSKGYIVTAEYKGIVSKTATDMVQYTAIFAGEAIQPAIESTTPAADYVLLPLLGAAIAFAAAKIYKTVKMRGGKNHEESQEQKKEQTNIADSGDPDGDDDAFPGISP